MDVAETADAPALFRALADETRLRILNLLAPGELCVGDLVRILGLPQPTASRHLGYLRRAGLVTVRKEGLWCFYGLPGARSGLVARLFECVRESRATLPRLREDDAGRRALLASGGCCPRPGRS